jgi:AraC-like DNA-binding protein
MAVPIAGRIWLGVIHDDNVVAPKCRNQTLLDISQEKLAGVAGLSVHHFARQFKQSAGFTPHFYLTQKRVERAQEMLVQTDLSLASPWAFSTRVT